MINKYCVLWIVLYLQDIVSAAASLSPGGDLPLIHNAAERITSYLAANVGVSLDPATLLSTPTNVGVSTFEDKMNWLFEKLKGEAKKSMRNQLARIVDGYSYRSDDKAAHRVTRYRIHFVLGLFEFIARSPPSSNYDQVIALSEAYPGYSRPIFPISVSSHDHKTAIESLIRDILRNGKFATFNDDQKSTLLRYISATAWFVDPETKLEMLQVVRNNFFREPSSADDVCNSFHPEIILKLFLSPEKFEDILDTATIKQRITQMNDSFTKKVVFLEPKYASETPAPPMSIFCIVKKVEEEIFHCSNNCFVEKIGGGLMSLQQWKRLYWGLESLSLLFPTLSPDCKTEFRKIVYELAVPRIAYAATIYLRITLLETPPKSSGASSAETRQKYSDEVCKKWKNTKADEKIEVLKHIQSDLESILTNEDVVAKIQEIYEALSNRTSEWSKATIPT